MFCKNCGTEIKEGVKFCPRCGKAVDAAGAPEAGQEAGGSVQSRWQQTVPEQKPHKSRSKLRIIIPVTAVVVVAALVAGGVAFSKTNFFRARFSSPESYYRYVESENIKNAENALKNMADNSNELTAVDVSMTLEDAGIMLFGAGLYDGEDALKGVNDLRLQMSVGKDGDISGQEYILYSQDARLLGISVTEDAANGDMYIQIPELSSSYLMMDAGSQAAMDVTPLVTQPLPSQAMPELLSLYAGIALDYATEVSRENTALTVDGITEDAILLTVDFDSDRLTQLVINCLETMQEDENLKELILWGLKMSGYEAYVRYGGTETAETMYDYYLQSIQELLTGLRDGDYLLTATASMNVWVNSEGRIIGRSMSVSDEGETVQLFSYQTASQKGAYATEAVIGDAGSSDYIMLKGGGTIENDLADGVFYVDMGGYEGFEVEVTDYDVKRDGEGYVNGTFAFSTDSEPELAGFGFEITLASDAGKQDTSMSLKSSGVPILTVHTSASKSTYVPKLPDTDGAPVYDIADSEALNQYVQELDAQALEDTLSKNEFLKFLMDYANYLQDYY